MIYTPQTSIENGYFVLTMMPSLFCDLRCPHCYLSKEQREDETRLSIDAIRTMCEKIDSYYTSTRLENKTIMVYWYGGEPTTMPMDYFEDAIQTINGIFNEDKGYEVEHLILTSLVQTDKKWFDFIKRHCNGKVQTSYDGHMRGRKYVRDWELKVREAQFHGLEVSTLTVMNSEIIKQGARATTEYLNGLGIKDTGWLPFMLNEQNMGRNYNRFAPTMDNWSSFMIEMSQIYADNIKADIPTFEIGQLQFVLTQAYRNDTTSNVAGQTLFLMPNGDLSLPDYRNGYEEYMRTFGNILESSFEEILASKGRLDYIAKQLTRNYNEDCLACDSYNRCVMEFWKENKEDDDCFGGKKYLNWLDQNIHMFSNIKGDARLA